MKIIVNEKNREKINEAILSAEGRANARCIGYSHIAEAIARIDAHLGIPKVYQVGISATVDYFAQHFPSAYKYTPTSTHFSLVRTSSGWAVTEIFRAPTKSPSNAIMLKLTDKAKEALVKSRETFSIV